VTLPDEAFIAHVESKLAAGTPLADLRTTQLFLACACARRDSAAIAYLEHESFGEIEAAHRRFPQLGVPLDDVLQRMREKLLLTNPPAILTFAGTGTLRAWVRASALNLLINLKQRETREEPTEAMLFEALLGGDGAADAAYVKLASRAEFEAALGAAMRTLDDRDKNLLRLAYVDGRNVDEIGALYAVHRATAARWVAAAREQLVARTLDDLTRRLQISPSEARSLIAAGLSGIGSMIFGKLM
jgi:RNA polymerase sigma-70 factor (ECF subfamily)